jgi:hypothetical protein
MVEMTLSIIVVALPGLKPLWERRGKVEHFSEETK